MNLIRITVFVNLVLIFERKQTKLFYRRVGRMEREKNVQIQISPLNENYLQLPHSTKKLDRSSAEVFGASF